jgi:hypothetical protein
MCRRRNERLAACPFFRRRRRCLLDILAGRCRTSLFSLRSWNFKIPFHMEGSTPTHSDIPTSMLEPEPISENGTLLFTEPQENQLSHPSIAWPTTSHPPDTSRKSQLTSAQFVAITLLYPPNYPHHDLLTNCVPSSFVSMCRRKLFAVFTIIGIGKNSIDLARCSLFVIRLCNSLVIESTPFVNGWVADWRL